MQLKDQPDIKYINSEIEVRPDGTSGFVLTIFTDLELDVMQPGHDQARVDSLTNAAFEHMRKFEGHFDVIRIRQVTQK
jgi:hypothetical protein